MFSSVLLSTNGAFASTAFTKSRSYTYSSRIVLYEDSIWQERHSPPPAAALLPAPAHQSSPVKLVGKLNMLGPHRSAVESEILYFVMVFRKHRNHKNSDKLVTSFMLVKNCVNFRDIFLDVAKYCYAT